MLIKYPNLRGYALLKERGSLLSLFKNHEKKGQEIQIRMGGCLLRVYRESISFEGRCRDVVEELVNRGLLVIGEGRECWGGIDEAGKGEREGPLVVSGVVVSREKIPDLIMLGVRDSKDLDKRRIEQIGTILKKILPHAIEVMEPEVYNSMYERYRNINKLIKLMVERVIDRLRCFSPEVVVIDAYSMKNIPERNRIKMVKGADRKDIAVMAASILAKFEYNRWMVNNKEKKKEKRFKLHFKGVHL